jgi:hypothetical protein
VLLGVIAALWIATGATGQLWLWHRWIERYPPANRRTVPWGDLVAVLLLGGLGGPPGLIPTIVDFASPYRRPSASRRRRHAEAEDDLEDDLF